MPLWAKVDVDMPTDEKLFGQPLATRHLWTCLICLAKRQDHAGSINGYDCSLLASRFNMPRKLVAAALNHYQAHKMVELDPDGTIRLLNFTKRQGDTSVTDRREQERDRQQKHRGVTRDKPPASRVTKAPRHAGVTLLDVEKEEERDGEKETTLPQAAIAAAAVVVSKPTVETATAYIEAFKARWLASPFQDDRPDSSANGLLARIVKKLGLEEAPCVAAYYLTTNDRLYVNAKHPLELLLRDAPKLRSEWAGARKSTATDARLTDQSQANAQGWMDTAESLIEEKKHGVV